MSNGIPALWPMSLAASLLLAAPPAVRAADTVQLVDEESAPPVHVAPSPASLKFSPYAGRKYPTRVYFGDTHHHTSNSGDAFMAGNRMGPEDAYRFARGEEVVSTTGIPVKLSRPLDFLVVSDHAEGLGVMYEVLKGNPAFTSDPTLARWATALKAGGEEAAKAKNELVSAQAQGTLPAPVKDPKIVGPVMKSVWKQYTATAEKYNEPGRFTAMIGYEWTSVPGGNNLHRNVLFRDGKDRADQVFPFSSWQSEDPEKLWAWMDAYEKKTGGRMLAIPHNGNLSNGRMFELTDFSGQPLTRDYAERRARWEVLQEIVQTKGASETHPTLSPNDEFAGDMGIAGWEYGNLTLEGKLETPEMRPTMYLRGGLMRGLEQEAKLGVNPFKFGMIGSSDVHTSLTAIEEDNFFGKEIMDEPNPQSLGSRHEGRAGKEALRLAAACRGIRRRLGDREHPRSVVGRDAAQGGVRHLRHAHDRALLRRLGLQSGRCARPRYRGRRLCEGRADGRRPCESAGGQGADVPRGRCNGPHVRQPRSHPDREGLARQGRQGAGAHLRRRLGRRGAAQARQEWQGPRGRKYGGREDRHLDEHDR